MNTNLLIKRLARRTTLRVAGLMSGTSADGIDTVIVDITRRGSGLRIAVESLAFQTFPYSAPLKKLVLALCRPGEATVDQLCHANAALGEAFAEAVIGLSQQARIPLSSIDLIGSHGQTVCHLPQGRRVGSKIVRSTLQIGEPSVIAERTGITTVADFRPRDMAVGGQGAPLVPFVDTLLLTDPKKSRVVQNIGGIGNLTWLPAGGRPEDVIAFDTGPGNMVIDRLVELMTQGRQHYDRGGKLAAAGHVDRELLKTWMRHPYFRKRPPKTTGREQFGHDFTDEQFRRAVAEKISSTDLVTTATAFTAHSIAASYRKFLPAQPDEVILCGGGAHNRTLVKMIEDEVTPVPVMSSDVYGIGVDEKEAIAFAVLGWATVMGIPNNLPSATGAEHAVVMGKIIPGRRD